MEFKQLTYLAAIYKYKSYTKAANELFITQPSLSNSIHKLEEELGVTLINREDKPISFTPEGKRFMKHALNILRAADDAVADMRSLTDSSERLLRVAWASTMGDRTISEVLMHFYDKYPDYSVFLCEDTQTGMLEHLEDGKYNLAYTHLPEDLDESKFESFPVQTCKFYVILSRQHPLAERKAISPEELSEDIIFTFPKGSLVRSEVEMLLLKHHIIPRFQLVTQMNFYEKLIGFNRGIAILPLDSNHSVNDSETIKAIPLKEAKTLIKGFIRKRNRPLRDVDLGLINYVESLLP